jgi:hypothetical protein
MPERPDQGSPGDARDQEEPVERPSQVPGPAPGLAGLLRRWWLLPTATFIAGLALGGLLVAAVESGEPADRLVRSAPAPTPSPEPSPTPGAGPGPCLEASQLAERLVALVREGVEALGQFDAARMQAVLDQIERLDPQIEARARQCRATAPAR